VAALNEGSLYTLVVSIGPHQPEEGISAALRIRDGDEAEQVPFSLELDSNAPQLRHESLPLPATRGAMATRRFPVDVTMLAPNDATWIWVRVTQQGRTIQNLQIKATAA
jgi:hypothetical protein